LATTFTGAILFGDGGDRSATKRILLGNVHTYKKVRIFTATEKIRTFSNIAMDMQEYMKFYRTYRKTKKYGFLQGREKFVLFPLQQDHAGNY